MEEKVRWTIQASENLEEIFDFLERTNSSEYASKVIENIYKKTEILNQYPKIG
jgi:plasmid stabilization system protein ParE